MARWVIDPDHTVATFSVGHMMVARVSGQFNRIRGWVEFDPSDIAASSVEVAAEAAGIYTGIQKRDDHLRSEDFLHVGRFAEVRFKSRAFETLSVNTFRVSGDVTIRGITLPLALEAEFFGPVKGPEGETTVGFAATGRLNREDFGMHWNVPFGPGWFMVGGEVHISIHAEADLEE
jgi:polyisoprenoid-binding protein YceI